VNDHDPGIIGAVLGSYRITAELSTGGMGTVYRAQHEILGRPAAVKLLRPELATNVELVQRFFTEAKAASAIHHPGIVEVFDFGYTSDDRAYLIMEFLEGESLARRLHARGGRIAEHEAAQITRGIASALTAAHNKGIIHRDLKPDNVFLVPDPDVPTGERPKLLDFGIAKLAGHLAEHRTQTGALIGTPLYMAPEQARAAGTIDHRADLYSLGCMLYQMLVGQPPFVAAGSGEIIALHLFTEPEPPSKRVPVTAELDAIVMRLLDKEPAGRFQSAAEVSDALGDAFGFVSGRMSAPLSALEMSRSGPHLQSLPVVTLLDERPPDSGPRTSRMPLIAGAVTLAVAIIAVVFFVLARSSDATPPAEPAQPAAQVPAPASPAVADKPAIADKPAAPKPHVDVAKPHVDVAKPHVDVAKPATPPPPHRPAAVVKRPPIATPPSHSTGPVVHPDSPTGGPVVHPDVKPAGPVTDQNSPIENNIGDSKDAKP
jgi:serine/threonine protein kinase